MLQNSLRSPRRVEVEREIQHSALGLRRQTPSLSGQLHSLSRTPKRSVRVSHIAKQRPRIFDDVARGAKFMKGLLELPDLKQQIPTQSTCFRFVDTVQSGQCKLEFALGCGHRSPQACTDETFA